MTSNEKVSRNWKLSDFLFKSDGRAALIKTPERVFFMTKSLFHILFQLQPRPVSNHIVSQSQLFQLLWL